MSTTAVFRQVNKAGKGTESKPRLYRRSGEASSESETARMVRRMLNRPEDNFMESESLNELLMNLKRSEARLQQIKELLVAQRGLVVQALRAAANLSAKVNVEEKEEFKEQKELMEEKEQKQCPMCEASFEVDDEHFEDHVVEHFVFEEADTIKYVGDLDNQEQVEKDEENHEYMEEQRRQR